MMKRINRAVQATAAHARRLRHLAEQGQQDDEVTTSAPPPAATTPLVPAPRRKLVASCGQKAPGELMNRDLDADIECASSALPLPTMAAGDAAKPNPYQRLLQRLRADGVGASKSTTSADDEAADKP